MNPFEPFGIELSLEILARGNQRTLIGNLSFGENPERERSELGYWGEIYLSFGE